MRKSGWVWLFMLFHGVLLHCRSAAAAVMMGDEYLPFARCRHDRNDFAAFGFREHPNSTSRQIYLTFPADSTFKEEDVSNYFR